MELMGNLRMRFRNLSTQFWLRTTPRMFDVVHEREVERESYKEKKKKTKLIWIT